MPRDTLMATMGVSRTTSDSARIFGALSGAGLFAAFGLGPGLSGDRRVVSDRLSADSGRVERPSAVATRGRRAPSLWRDLREGLAYVWDTPASLAALWLAFLVNLTAFPLTSGLLPYVARDVYRIGETGLGTLVASFALGSFLGSIAVSMRAACCARPA